MMTECGRCHAGFDTKEGGTVVCPVCESELLDARRFADLLSRAMSHSEVTGDDFNNAARRACTETNVSLEWALPLALLLASDWGRHVPIRGSRTVTPYDTQCQKERHDG